MNNLSNFNVNHLINEKHLAKSIARCSKFKRYILDLNSEQFSYKYADFPRRLKIRKKKWKKNFKTKKKLFSKKMFFNKEVVTYFMRRKRDLKFLFLKNSTTPKKSKYKNILYHVKHLKSNGLITKPVKKGFKVVSNKVRGFIYKKALVKIIKKFKIRLLKNSKKLTNSMYLSNLHNLSKFIFHKLTLVRKIDNYNNFRLFADKYNKKRKKRVIKLKNKIGIKYKKKLNHEKKINIKKRIKKNNKQKYSKRGNNTKRSTKIFANKQKQSFTKSIQ